MKLQWEKQSHKRYSANLGPCTIEVRKVGIAGINVHWTVGEVLGRHLHSSERYPCPNSMILYEAQEMAERVAADMIATLARSPVTVDHDAPIDFDRVSVRLDNFLAENGCRSMGDARVLLGCPVWHRRRKIERELRAIVYGAT